MAAEAGLALTIYTAEPGSASAERVQLLASWAATNDSGDAFRRDIAVRRAGGAPT